MVESTMLESGRDRSPSRRSARSGRLGSILLACTLALGGLTTACAQPAVVLDSGKLLPPGFRVRATVGGSQRRPVVTASAGHRQRTWGRVRRPAPPPRAPSSTPKVLRPRSTGATTVDRTLPPDADRNCLAGLSGWGIPFVTAGTVKGIETPVEITGPIGGVRLISRGRKAPLMDCELARALAEAAPGMRQLGITGLSFSGTYDYRNVRGSSKLSGHAYGLAIDVHALETSLGTLDVERDYAKDGDRWHGSRGGGGNCVGAPARPQGRVLRALACQLRAHGAFALILTPDDNYDHRNHLHIEAHPHRPSNLYSGGSPRPSQGRSGRRARR
jgi:hypothetical protein